MADQHRSTRTSGISLGLVIWQRGLVPAIDIFALCDVGDPEVLQEYLMIGNTVALVDRHSEATRKSRRDANRMERDKSMTLKCEGMTHNAIAERIGVGGLGSVAIEAGLAQ